MFISENGPDFWPQVPCCPLKTHALCTTLITGFSGDDQVRQTINPWRKGLPHSKKAVAKPVGGRLALSPSSCLWLAFLWKQNITDYKLLFWTIWQAVSEIRVLNAAVWVIKNLEVRTVCANNAMRNTKSNWNSPRRFSFWITGCRLIKIQGMSGRPCRKKPYWAYPVIYSPQG